MFPKALLFSLLAGALSVNALAIAREPQDKWPVQGNWPSYAGYNLIPGSCKPGEPCEKEMENLQVMMRRASNPYRMLFSLGDDSSTDDSTDQDLDPLDKRFVYPQKDGHLGPWQGLFD